MAKLLNSSISSWEKRSPRVVNMSRNLLLSTAPVFFVSKVLKARSSLSAESRGVALPENDPGHGTLKLFDADEASRLLLFDLADDVAQLDLSGVDAKMANNGSNLPHVTYALAFPVDEIKGRLRYAEVHVPAMLSAHPTCRHPTCRYRHISASSASNAGVLSTADGRCGLFAVLMTCLPR